MANRWQTDGKSFLFAMRLAFLRKREKKERKYQRKK
jgi:hypothetical protein